MQLNMKAPTMLRAIPGGRNKTWDHEFNSKEYTVVWSTVDTGTEGKILTGVIKSPKGRHYDIHFSCNKEAMISPTVDKCITFNIIEKAVKKSILTHKIVMKPAPEGYSLWYTNTNNKLRPLNELSEVNAIEAFINIILYCINQ